MDIFDTFTDKLELFKTLSENSTQPLRFILINLPAQLYTHYNYKRAGI